MMAKALAHALDAEAHWLAADGGEPLDAQHLEFFRDGAKRGDELVRCIDFRDGDDKALEIVVFVLAVFRIVVRRAGVEVVFGGGVHAEQHGEIDPALARRNDLDGAGYLRGDVTAQTGKLRLIDQVGFVDDDKIGRRQLILIDFGQRIVVIERRVLGALAGHRLGVVGEPPLGGGRSIDDGDNTVDRDARPHSRPVERLEQRLGQGKPRCFDENMFGWVVAGDQRLHRRDELVGDGAAQAAVGQLDNIALATAFDAALAQSVPVNADGAEFVDDNGDPAPASVFKYMPHHGCFARAEKPSDDGGGNFIGGSHSAASFS